MAAVGHVGTAAILSLSKHAVFEHDRRKVIDQHMPNDDEVMKIRW
jgi:hypothetical protein